MFYVELIDEIVVLEFYGFVVDSGVVLLLVVESHYRRYSGGSTYLPLCLKLFCFAGGC
mgnify:FL=1